jgi:hypothetical protein
MKFEYRHGLIWLNVDILYEGLTVKIDKCILDTGSATTAINIDMVNLNYQKPTKIKRLFGIGNGTQEVISQNIDAITFGESIVKNIDVKFGMFDSKLSINGFIGNDILSKFNMELNFFNLEIVLKQY